MLSVLDRKWREHLYEMDYLKEGIGLRAMAQRDPLVEYQREGFDMFAAMLDSLKEESVGFLYNLQVQVVPAGEQPGRGDAARRSSPPRRRRPRRWATAASAASRTVSATVAPAGTAAAAPAAAARAVVGCARCEALPTEQAAARPATSCRPTPARPRCAARDWADRWRPRR